MLARLAPAALHAPSRLKSAVMQTPLYPAARSVHRALFRRAAEAHRVRMGAFYSSPDPPPDVVCGLIGGVVGRGSRWSAGVVGRARVEAGVLG
jgi:hypothetical protein